MTRLQKYGRQSVSGLWFEHTEYVLNKEAGYYFAHLNEQNSILKAGVSTYRYSASAQQKRKDRSTNVAYSKLCFNLKRCIVHLNKQNKTLKDGVSTYSYSASPRQKKRKDRSASAKNWKSLFNLKCYMIHQMQHIFVQTQLISVGMPT